MILSVLSSLALVSGLMVVCAKNPVHSVLFLILVFRDTSGLLLLLGLDFFAMIFLVGAIAVSFLVMIPRKWIWKGAKFLLTKSIAYFFVLWIAPVLWDWGLAWVSPLVVFYEEFLSFLLSSMERLPLYGGGGSSDAGPSRRLDLNRIPSPSPEPEPPAEPPAEPEPEIPRLDQPLISDRERFIELQERFHVYYLGRNRITDLAEFAGRLERAVPIEINIEAALVFDGYDPDRIRGRINEIRGILFTHPTRALLLSEQTLDLYLNEILTNGTRQSAPYMRVVRAIRDSYLIL